MKPPVKCVKCKKTAVITSKAADEKQGGVLRWRYRCLDCTVAWWVDDHEGLMEDFSQEDQ